MKSVKVVPLIPGISKDYLTYIYSGEIEVGQILEFPFRKKSVLGLVFEIDSISGDKAELKSLTTKIRKVSNLQQKYFVVGNLLNSIKKTADIYGISYSDILWMFFPKNFADFLISNQSVFTIDRYGEDIKINSILKVQKDYIDLVTFYEDGILDKKRSIIVCPTVEKAEEIYKILHKKNDRIYILHGRKTPSAQNKIYSEITQSDKKVVLVCTPHFFVTLPNPDIVFIDEFESKHYYSIKPSFVSLVEFFKIYSKKTSTEILFCDNFIKSMADKNKSGVVDFVDMTDSSEATKHFWLSKTLGSKIKNTVLDKKNVVLYISRKGLSTQSICSDCRTPLTCSSCYTFLTLIKNGSSYSYSCNHCNTNKALESNDIVLCSKCSGFNFKTLGIGTQTVEKELLELGYRVFVYDKNNNDKVLSKNKTIESFYKTPGSVLIVNTLEPKILLKKTDFAAIVSMDSSLSIPFYDIDFYNLKTIKTLASISTSKIVVQTRLRKNAFFDNLFSREDFFNLKDSISNDLKKLIYPPFSTVVEIVSYDDLSKTLDLESEVLEGKIKSFGRKVKNFYVYYIFFRNESWEKNSIKYLYRIKKISDRLKVRVHRF